MARYLLAVLAIFALIAAWLFVQASYRRFAERHPELGPFRQEGAGCGGCGGCASGCEERRSAVD